MGFRHWLFRRMYGSSTPPDSSCTCNNRDCTEVPCYTCHCNKTQDQSKQRPDGSWPD